MMVCPSAEVLRLFNASPSQWANWQWQMKNSVRHLDPLGEILTGILGISLQDLGFDPAGSNPLEIKVTPHVIANICEAAERYGLQSIKPFLAIYMPTRAEEVVTAQGLEIDDGRGELSKNVNPVRSIIDFFHNRVLLMVESVCPAYCRYCFRRSVIGDGIGFYNRSFLGEGLEYIRQHPEISEVILSGGDPMILADGPLSDILDGIRKISHVKIIRIDTKTQNSVNAGGKTAMSSLSFQDENQR